MNRTADPVRCEDCAGQGVLSLDGSSPSARLIRCEYCDGEGRIYRGYPDERDEGQCSVCEGTGTDVVETEPVTEEEIMEAANV